MIGPTDVTPTDAQLAYRELTEGQSILLRAVFYLQNRQPYALYVTGFDAMNLLQDLIREIELELDGLTL